MPREPTKSTINFHVNRQWQSHGTRSRKERMKLMLIYLLGYSNLCCVSWFSKRIFFFIHFDFMRWKFNSGLIFCSPIFPILDGLGYIFLSGAISNWIHLTMSVRCLLLDLRLARPSNRNTANNTVENKKRDTSRIKRRWNVVSIKFKWGEHPFWDCYRHSKEV